MNRQTSRFAVVLLVLAGAILAGGWHLLRETGRLRAEVAALRLEHHEPGKPETAGTIDEDRHDVLQRRVEVLRATVLDAERAAAMPLPRLPDAARRPPASAESSWTNAGRGNPMATVETIMWAAAGGDASVIAESTAFDDDARLEAERLFAVLPPDVRAGYADAKHFVAAVMATRLPFGNEEVERLAETAVDGAGADLRLRWGTGPRTREITLRFRRGEAGYLLLVPARVIEGYRHIVIGTTAVE
jgi:hypothetical protein